jgi:hypothetical protein
LKSSGAGARLSQSRRRAISAALLLGVLVLWAVTSAHYPLGRWLVSVYLPFVLGGAYLGVACVAAGHALLTRGFRLFLPVREHLFLSFAGGLLLFGLAVFGLGIAHQLRPALFWFLPLAVALPGAQALYHYLRRYRRRVTFQRSLAKRRNGVALPTLAVWLFGGLGVALLYAGTLLPANASYDARWYHLALAEHYAAAGAITRFPEGFFGAVWPHLASFLYTWAFLPRVSLGAQMELALHLEFVVFVATLFGLPVLVRWMLHGRRAPASWAAVFLFPGILLYDSNLAGGADHVLALWVLAASLSLRRLASSFERRWCVLFAAFVAAAALTKYQSVSALTSLVTGFAACALLAALRARRGASALRLRTVFASVASAALVFVVLWAPHWLKNLLWHGDPFYPLLRGVLHDRPWAEHAVAGFAQGEWRPTSIGPSELWTSLAVVFTFSFVPHDWPHFHGQTPVFGSLFTLLLLPLALLWQTGRTWAVATAAMASVWIWYLTFHQDRYLQALLPWMAAVVAVVVIRLWEARGLVRGALCALLGFQILWGADVAFLPTHTVMWRAPMQALVELASSGYRGSWQERLATLSELEPLASQLPQGSKVLLHESEPRLGTGTMVVTDARAAQGGIDYTSLRSPAAVFELLKSFGVTHLVWKDTARAEQTLSNEVFFLFFATSYAEAQWHEGALTIGRMPGASPPAHEPVVALRGCGVTTRPGLDQLDSLPSLPPGTLHGSEAPPFPDVWLIDERCSDVRPNPQALVTPKGYEIAGRFPPVAIARLARRRP